MAKDKTAPWTPYGLEHIRVGRIRRNRLLALLIMLLLLGLIAAFFTTSTTRQQQIFANGQQVGGGDSTITITKPDQKKAGPVTIGLTPGLVSRADAGNAAPASSLQQSALPEPVREAPINWNAYLLLYGPYVLVGLGLLYFLGKRSKHDEVNFGVFKGAMPLEMITSSHHTEVFTKRFVKESIFGKGRDHHLPRHLASLESAVVEEEG